MLVGNKGNVAGDSSMVRFLVELGLASNAPTPLKVQVRYSFFQPCPPYAT